uniref:Uncharacterized protein n=1 Tax=Rhizophora mucronata TaxID=61149 RepID=A0A2P2PWE5_RHIMU
MVGKEHGIKDPCFTVGITVRTLWSKQTC